MSPPSISGPKVNSLLDAGSLLTAVVSGVVAAWAGIDVTAKAENASADPAAIRVAVLRVFFTFISS